jgi:putative membrane protein
MKPNTCKLFTFTTALLSLSVSAIFLFASCNSNPKPEDPKKEATEHNNAKFSNANEADAKFLVTASEINLAEIQLGKLAESKSMMPDVKDLGATMNRDHTKADIELQELAAAKQISLPGSITNDGQEAYKKMMNESGNHFDKAYCDMMVSGHKDAIDKFEKASMNAVDPDIKAWASSMLPLLRTHLDHALNCQKTAGK